MQNLIAPAFAAALLCTGISAHAVLVDVKISNIVVTPVDTIPGDSVLPSYSISNVGYSLWAGQHATMIDPVFHFGANGMLTNVEARVNYQVPSPSYFSPEILDSYGDFYFQFNAGDETALTMSFDATLSETGPAGDQIFLNWQSFGFSGPVQSDSFSNPYVSPDTHAAYVTQAFSSTRHIVLTANPEGVDGSFLFGLTVDAQVAANVVPEPASVALMLAGLGTIGAVAGRRRRAPMASL